MRLRVTTHLPLDGARIGLTLWVGSSGRGWRGFPVFRRGMRYRILSTRERAKPVAAGDRA